MGSGRHKADILGSRTRPCHPLCYRRTRDVCSGRADPQSRLEQRCACRESEEIVLARNAPEKEFCLVRENTERRSCLENKSWALKKTCLPSGREAASDILLCPFQPPTQSLSKETMNAHGNSISWEGTQTTSWDGELTDPWGRPIPLL